MRVLHLLSSTGFHGAETMAAALIRELQARGVENYVGVFHSHEGSNTELLKVVENAIAGGTVFTCRGKLDVAVIGALRRYIRDQKIDVVHSHKYKTNFYAAAACVGLKRVLVSTCHNWLGTTALMRFYAAFDKRVLAMFDSVVGVSDEVARELRKYLAPDRVVKIDNGIDTERFEPTLSTSDAKKMLGLGERPVVGFVGRLAADKAVADLLRAAQALHARALNVAVVVVGDGECAQALQREAAALGIGAHVHFLGRRDDTPAIYAAMDVFVLPSFKEAFPMVVLEAMAAGVPVVATAVGDTGYILDGGACGTVVPPGDVAALAAAVGALLTDAPTARARAAAARRRVRQHFSSAAMAQRYQELYNDLYDTRYGGLRSVG